MALNGQALGHRLVLGVPQENARHQPLFLCESENWPNEVLVDPVARAGIAAQPSRGRGDQQVLDRAPAGRVVLLVSNFFLSAHHGNEDHDWGRKTLSPSEVESVFAHLLPPFSPPPNVPPPVGLHQALAPLSGEHVETPGMGSICRWVPSGRRRATPRSTPEESRWEGTPSPSGAS